MTRDPKADAHLELINDLEVWVIRKAVKHVRINVKADGRIEMSVPRRYPLSEAIAFAQSKQSWIRKTLSRMEHSLASQAERATDEEKRAWREVVSACVPVLVAEWESIMGVKAGTLAYRNMKSRWGSCQPATGRICINTRLALYPPECLEYVVIHELCHLRERGHGPAFYALMDRYLPDWKERRAKLV